MTNPTFTRLELATARRAMAPRFRTICAAAAMVLLAMGSACSGSRQAGAEEFEKARVRYEELVTQGKAPWDPGFDEVLALLARVPGTSEYSEKARRLERAIVELRTPRAPQPLATSGGSIDAGISALRDVCADLARQLGEAKGDDRRDLAMKLAECRRTVDTRRETQHHDATPQEPNHEG